MKRFIILVYMAGCIAAAQAQPLQYEVNAQKQYFLFPQEMMYKSYPKVNIPFYDGNAVRAASLNRQSSSDTIWLPASVSDFWDGSPNGHTIYEYHENGFLKKTTSYIAVTGELFNSYDCNNIYSDPLMDIIDTIFQNAYIDPETGEYHPPYRYYYNNRQADSSYWEEYYQAWDGNKWKAGQKTCYVHLLDTATVSEFQDHVELYDGNGRQTYGHKVFLTFDEQGNVIEAMGELYDVASHQYKVAAKDIYLYDDEGKCHTGEHYVFTSGTWKLNSKLTNMKWFEFHGFDDGGMLFFGRPLGIQEWYPLKNKNKVSSLEHWVLNGGSLDLTGIDTIQWETEPFSYNATRYTENECLMICEYKNYNEHKHMTAQGQIVYNYFACDPDEILQYILDDYFNKYDERGRRYEYIEENTAHLVDWPLDSIHHVTIIYVVDSFTYVGCPVDIEELFLAQPPLSIVPNPASGIVTIAAATEIEQLNVFDITGRLVSSQTLENRQVVFDTSVLPKGVYLVRTVLRDGGVQTGKMVVN